MVDIRQPKPLESKLSKSRFKANSFWRIAEDIPQSLSWILFATSIVVPILLWF